MDSKNQRHLKANGGGFTRPVANLTAGGSPDRGNNPVVQRSTVTSANLSLGAEFVGQGLVTAPGAADPRPSAVFTVADNDFTAAAVIKIGDREFRSNVDFLPGAGVNDTATAIAGMFAAMPGWTGIAALAVVTVRYPHPGKIRFEAQHYGTVTNFTPLVPSSGLMQYGGIQPGPPTLT